MADEKAEPTPLLAMAEKIHEHAHRGCLHDPEPISEMEMALAQVMLDLEANPNFEVNMTVKEPEDLVSIPRDDLEMLLEFAQAGDLARSKRTWKHRFRKHTVCSGADREPLCEGCRAFISAEEALRRG
jgi:hypothetical protein